MIGYVYRITNIINNKTYIGSRYYSQDEGKEWTYYMGSGIYIKNAINKYGKDKFIKEKLYEAETKDDLINAETKFIKEEKELGHGEYNLSLGYVGGDTFSKLTNRERDDVKKKISNSLKEKYKNGEMTSWNKGKNKETNEILRKKSERAILLGTYKNHRENYTHSDISKKKMSEKAVGNKNSYKNKELSSRIEKSVYEKERKILNNGKNSIEFHDEMIGYDWEKLRNEYTIKEIAKKFNVSTTFIKNFLRRHGFILNTTSNDTICLLCESRKKGI